MKKILLFVFLLPWVALSQTFRHYEDAANHFKIDFPKDWAEQPSKYPNLKLAVFKIDKGSKTSINLTVIDSPGASLDQTAADVLEPKRNAKNFTLHGQGDTEIHKRAFKWFYESHANSINPELEMHTLVYVTVTKGQSYVLTMVTSPAEFAATRPVFEKIAQSLEITQD